MVGVERFELPTSCSQSRRATRLRYTPLTEQQVLQQSWRAYYRRRTGPSTLIFRIMYITLKIVTPPPRPIPQNKRSEERRVGKEGRSRWWENEVIKVDDIVNS